MGLFRKSEYNFQNAIKKSKKKGFENCIIEQGEKGYIITKASKTTEKQEFINRINGNGAYQEIKYVPCDYEKATNRWNTRGFGR